MDHSSGHTEEWESLTPTGGATPKRGKTLPGALILPQCAEMVRKWPDLGPPEPAQTRWSHARSWAEAVPAPLPSHAAAQHVALGHATPPPHQELGGRRIHVHTGSPGRNLQGAGRGLLRLSDPPVRNGTIGCTRHGAFLDCNRPKRWTADASGMQHAASTPLRVDVCRRMPACVALRTLGRWQSPCARRHSSGLSESGIRAGQCYNRPRACVCNSATGQRPLCTAAILTADCCGLSVLFLVPANGVDTRERNAQGPRHWLVHRPESNGACGGAWRFARAAPR